MNMNFNGESNGSALFAMKANGGRLHWLHVTNVEAGEDAFIHLFDRQTRSGVASNYNGTVAGTVLITMPSGMGVGHNLGDAGTEVDVQVLSTNHSGVKTVTIVDQWSFYFTDTYVATDTVLFFLAVVLGTTAPVLTILVPGVVATKPSGYDGNPGFHFEEGIIAGITTTADGSAGVPTSDKVISASYLR